VLSLAGNHLVRHFGHVCTPALVGAIPGLELGGQLHALAKRKRVTVVVEVHLRLARLACIHRSDCSVLLVEPSPLNISLPLGILLFAVNFSNKVRNNLGALLIHRANTCTSIICVVISTFLNFWCTFAVEVSVFGVESAHVVGWFVVRNH